jgi:hypothetical protein
MEWENMVLFQNKIHGMGKHGSVPKQNTWNGKTIGPRTNANT